MRASPQRRGHRRLWDAGRSRLPGIEQLTATQGRTSSVVLSRAKARGPGITSPAIPEITEGVRRRELARTARTTARQPVPDRRAVAKRNIAAVLEVGTRLTILMCAEIDNAGVARTCLECGIGYVDVSAFPHVLAESQHLDDLARELGVTAALKMGLVPGITNLLARICAERSPATELRIGVLLGSEEQHGRAAIAWTLDGLGQLDGSWTMRFPAPFFGTRTVHRSRSRISTRCPALSACPPGALGLCMDSHIATGLLSAAGRPAARLLRRRKVRDLLLTAPALSPGVQHIEQLVDPLVFLTELAADGFDLRIDHDDNLETGRR
jgi:hypothetical protein